MRTVRRVLLIGLVAVVVVGLVGWFGLRAYLNSSGARRLAAGRLSEMLGLPVQVDGLSVGADTSTLQFRVLEPAADGRPPQELLRVESATTDVSMGDLVRQTVKPTELTLSGVTVTLRVDKDGRLLTKLPDTTGAGGGELPAVRVENGTVRIQQEGRPEFVVTGIRGRLEPKAGVFALDGGATDPNWGEWAVAGSVDPKAGTGRADLTTAAGRLDMALLQSIPFVPAETWEHVRASGTTPAKVTLSAGTGRPFEYAVELTPTGAADVQIPDIDATVTGVSGGVRIAGAKVQLLDMKGAVADGRVTVGGDLDFAQEPAVLKFRVAAAGADVRKLPAEWSLPKQLTGRLKGQAELEIRVPEVGPNQYGGGGSAVVEGATVAGLPAEVTVRLRSDGRRYRFDSGGPPTNSRSDAAVVRPPVRTVRRQPPAETKRTDEPTTIDATVTLRDVDAAELLTRLEVKVPYRLSGKVTVTASVSIPVAQADDTRAYRFAGTLASPDFAFEGLRVRDLSAELRFADGVLRLPTLRGKVGDGEVKGTASVAVRPAGDLTADLTLDRVALAEALKAIPDAAIDVRGPVTGIAQFRAPYERLTDPATWSGSADLRSDGLVAYGRTVTGVRLPVALAAGTLTATAARATVEGVPLTADGSLALTRPFAFTAAAKTAAVEVADFRRLVPELDLPFPLAGKLDTTAKLTGTVSPFAFTANGTAASDELTVGTRGANRVRFEWAADAERVRVPQLSAALFGGTVTGSADIPLSAEKAGRFDVAFKEVDAAAAAKAVPDLPLRLSGKVSGDLKGTLPAAEPGKPRTPTADLDLSAPRLTVQGIPAERLTGKVGFAGGGVEYKLEGRSLGGTFEVNGRYPSKPKPAPAERGSVRFRGLNLREAARAFGLPELAPLRGTADLAFEFDDDLADGTGRLAVRDLRWGETVLAPSLTAVLRLRDGFVELSDVTGTLAGGQLRGRGRLGRSARSYVTLTLDRADAARLFAPFPAVAENVTGEVSLAFRGRPVGAVGGSGTLVLNRGTVFGLPASELRLPFDWADGTGSTMVTVRDAGGRVGDGRVTGSLAYTGGASSRLDGRLQFADVRLGSAVSALRGNSYLGQGRVTGRFDFGAAPFRTADDLTGRLSATLNQTAVQEIPILRQAAPFLSPTGLTAPFQSGELVGKLSRGVFRVDRLNLANPAAQLHAEGTITLAGRLDLDVVANTGRLGVDDRAARLLGLRLPAAGPIPLTLLRDVSDFLSNRTVRLSITGTTDAPQVRVNAAALLSEEAVRFLLSRYVPGLAAGSVFSDLDR